MANRFYSPNQQFADATGTPYAGGSLTFYASGTSTPLATYSDSALTVPNANPVVLDSAGRAGDIFLQNLAYKVVLADVNANQIWTKDPVYSSDYSAAAKFFSGSGNPNGFVAGTAGSATIKADSYWDYTNTILYVCTTTGNAAAAVWTAINASTAANLAQFPTGRLTLTSGTPVLSSDVVAATAVVYTPYVGNTVPIYNGSSISNQTFSELTLTLSVANAINTLYDVFIFNNSGVLTLVTGPAWSVNTAGSCSRGAGAGTTQLARISGMLFNAVQITGKNGVNTYTIGANLATYLGTIFIDGTAGQVSCYVTWGQSRKWGVWNAYNRTNIFLQGGDSTASWNYNSNVWRTSNANSNNNITTLCGLAEDTIDIRFEQVCSASSVASGSVSIGINANGSMVGKFGWAGSPPASTADIGKNDLIARYIQLPALGMNLYTANEQTPTMGGATNQTFFGSANEMLLSALYRG